MEVELNDVIEAIEYSNESLDHYYNKKTGIIIYVEKDKSLDNLNNLEDWEKELYILLKEFKKNPENYIKLPNTSELSEDEIMLEFLKSIADTKFLNSSIYDVRKTFDEKSLKKYIENQNKLSDYFDFRGAVDIELAKSWCKKNSINVI